MPKLKLNISLVAVWIRTKGHWVGSQMNKHRHLLPLRKPYSIIFCLPYQRATILWRICEPQESESLSISSFRLEILNDGSRNVLKINKELLLAEKT